jgi:cytochrome b6-f complex iron-sulfur subunit
VSPFGGSYRCPCHGSMYDSDGVRTGGPAPRPLDLMKITVVGDGSVHVATGDITTRADYVAHQPIPYST